MVCIAACVGIRDGDATEIKVDGISTLDSMDNRDGVCDAIRVGNGTETDTGMGNKVVLLLHTDVKKAIENIFKKDRPKSRWDRPKWT